MLAIVGTRDADVEKVKHWLNKHRSLIPIQGIITSSTGNVGQAAQEWARAEGITCDVRIPLTERFGRDADGFLRQELANRCISVVAFWDGRSRGTFDMIRKATIAGKMVRVVPISILA